MPMAVATFKKKEHSTEITDLINFAGTCFFVDDEGTVATCAHCIEYVDFSKHVIIGLNLKTKNPKDFVLINDFLVVEGLDMAFGKTILKGNKYFKPFKGKIEIGFDLMCLGFNLHGANSENIEISPRLHKGHVVRAYSRPDKRLRCLSQFELSFPVTFGFSGAPVISHNHQLVGMAYGNYESRIDVFQADKTLENNGYDGIEKRAKTISRVLEFGLMHQVSDIIKTHDSLMKSASTVVQ
jgi:hypothetical protein